MPVAQSVKDPAKASAFGVLEADSLKEVETVLSRVPLFDSLDREELQGVAAMLTPKEFAAGETLFREGDRGEHLYIIWDGLLEVVKAADTPDERLIARRGPGDYIGEMSLFKVNRRRTSTVRAAERVRVLEMGQGALDALLHRHPGLAYEMVRVLTERLEASQNSAIRDLQAKNEQLRRAYEELKAAQAQLIEKETMERELQVANRIQMSILPHSTPDLTGVDFGTKLVPMRGVGGDFFDFVPFGPELAGIAIGDVSGHGVPAALLMTTTLTLLRAESRRSRSPREVLLEVNRQLLGLRLNDMFVTMLYGVLDSTTGEFTYSRAGHELPILVDSGGNPVPQDLERGMILGFVDEPRLSEVSIKLDKGSALLLHTDGVIEAANSNSELFGEERLLQVLHQGRALSAQALCQRIFDGVTEYRGALAQQDDITLVCAHL